MTIRAGIARDSGRLWVAFPETPDDATRATLRAHGLTWHTIQRRWMTPRGERVTAGQIRAVYLLTGVEIRTHREKSIEKSVDAFTRLGSWYAAQPPATVFEWRWSALESVRREWVEVVCGQFASWSTDFVEAVSEWAERLATVAPQTSEARAARDAAASAAAGASRRYRRLAASLAVVDWCLAQCGGGDALAMLTGDWPC